MKIGVLGLQGDVREHASMINECGADTVIVKRPSDLDDINGLVIPGGESTTVGLLMNKYGFIDKIRSRVAEGMGVFGTCTGLILLASEIENSAQYKLNLMNMVVRRNAFGRQVDSGEADIDIPILGEKPFHTVFIRAPHILSTGEGCQVLATYNDAIVLAQQDKLLASAFHPELVWDIRLHKYFIKLVEEQ